MFYISQFPPPLRIFKLNEVEDPQQQYLASFLKQLIT